MPIHHFLMMTAALYGASSFDTLGHKDKDSMTSSRLFITKHINMIP
jgi:hypothetical protein